VIRLSISCGLTQGYDVEIAIIPNFISGKDSFGIVKSEKSQLIKIRNKTRKESRLFFTQNQKNHDSKSCIILFIKIIKILRIRGKTTYPFKTKLTY